MKANNSNIGLFIGLFAVGFGGFAAWRLGWFATKTPAEKIAEALQQTPREIDFIRAGVLHSAMRQCWRKFDLVELFESASSYYETTADVYRLFTAFGRRPYDKCFTGLPDWAYTDLDLFQWFAQVGSKDEISALNQWFADRNIQIIL